MGLCAVGCSGVGVRLSVVPEESLLWLTCDCALRVPSRKKGLHSDTRHNHNTGTRVLTRSHRPLAHSPTRPLAHSPTRPLAHSLTRSLAHSLTRSLAREVNSHSATTTDRPRVLDESDTHAPREAQVRLKSCRLRHTACLCCPLVPCRPGHLFLPLPSFGAVLTRQSLPDAALNNRHCKMQSSSPSATTRTGTERRWTGRGFGASSYADLVTSRVSPAVAPCLPNSCSSTGPSCVSPSLTCFFASFSYLHPFLRFPKVGNARTCTTINS